MVTPIEFFVSSGIQVIQTYAPQVDGITPFKFMMSERRVQPRVGMALTSAVMLLISDLMVRLFSQVATDKRTCSSYGIYEKRKSLEILSGMVQKFLKTTLLKVKTSKTKWKEMIWRTKMMKMLTSMINNLVKIQRELKTRAQSKSANPKHSLVNRLHHSSMLPSSITNRTLLWLEVQVLTRSVCLTMIRVTFFA